MPKLQPGWMLLETLEPSRFSVVAIDHKPRSRSKFDRALIDRLGGGKAPAAEAAAWLETLIVTVRADPKPLAVAYTLRNGMSLRARLIPALGPDGSLHGVHLWLGPPNTLPDRPPLSAFGLVWDSRLRIAEIPALLAAGLPQSTLTAPELFRFLELPDAMSLIKTVLMPAPSAAWDGALSMNIAQRKVPAHAVLVAADSQQQAHRWRGLLFETVPPETAPTPSLEAAALAAIPRMSHMHMALVDIAKMRLIRWITDPMTDVQWKGQVDQRDTPHPDDVKRIFDAAGEIFGGKADYASVEGIRLRRRGGGWVVVDSAGSLVQTSGEGPLLAVIQFQVTGYSDAPDPVPSSDQGHPGLDDPEYPGGPVPVREQWPRRPQ